MVAKVDPDKGRRTSIEEIQNSLPQTSRSPAHTVPPRATELPLPLAGASEVSPLASPNPSFPSEQSLKSKGTEASPLPLVIERDFAYAPKPPLKEWPIDERWVVRTSVRPNAVPGAREREAKAWETSHSYLYRMGGNRADPPNTIPKTWGGLPKEKDDWLMRRAQARILVRRRKAEALGLTPTEPNLQGPGPTYPSSDEEDREAVARVEAELRENEERLKAAGYPPLVRTPTNTPPPERRRVQHILSPSPEPLCRPLPRRLKRKLVESNSEQEEEKRPTAKRRVRKRQGQKQGKEDPGATEPNPSRSPRYSLRQRRTTTRV